MARRGFDEVTVALDNSGGSPTTISSQVTTINGVTKEAMLEEVTAAGDQWAQHAKTGLSRVGEIVLEGFYDDTITTTVHAIAGGNTDLGAIRTLTIGFGGSKTVAVETLIKTYERRPARGELTKYRLALMPTGAPTEV